MTYARTTVVDPAAAGDTVKQGVIDLDTDVTGIFANLNTHEGLTATHGASGTVVGTTSTQTLTNKTLSTPTITNFTNATHGHTTATTGGYALAGGPSYSQADGATIAVDWNNGSTQYVTIASTGRAVTFANPVEGQTYNLIVIQGSGGSKTITSWPTISWAGGSAPTLTTTAGKADIVTLKYCNGVYYASCTHNF